MVSMARIPVTIGSSMCSRSSGLPGGAIQAVCGRPDGRLAVDGAAEAVQHAVEQVGPDGHLGVVLAGDDAVAQLDAVDLFERHGEHVAVAEADHLHAHAASAGGDDLAEIAHRGRRSRDATSMPTSSTTSPVHGSRAVAHLLDVGIQGRSRDRGGAGALIAVLQPVGKTARDFVQLRADRRVERAAADVEQDAAGRLRGVGDDLDALAAPDSCRLARTSFSWSG
jgi:hypothetical protein